MVELFSTVAIWGLSFALAKKALNHLHPLELVTIRLLLAAITATLIQWTVSKWAFRNNGGRRPIEKAHEMEPQRWRSYLPALSIGLFEFSGTYILYTWSLKYLPSGVVGTLTLLTPALTFMVALMARVQSFRVGALVGTLLSIAGALLCLPAGSPSPTAVISLDFSHDVMVGLGLILASNLMFALGNVAISKFQGLKSLTPYTTPLGLWIGGVFSLVVCVASGAEVHDHDLSITALALPLYLGVIATGVGFYLWNRGVEKTSALTASFIGNFKAPLSLIWGAFLLGEALNIRLVLGLVLLLLATRLVKNERPLVPSPERLPPQRPV